MHRNKESFPLGEFIFDCLVLVVLAGFLFLLIRT